MSEDAPHTLSRRTVVGAAWASPIVLAAVAAPASAASQASRQLDLYVSPPARFGPPGEQFAVLTQYIIRVTNDSATEIPAGGLTATVLLAPDFFFAGYDGVSTWTAGPPDSSGATSTLVYTATVAAGEIAGPLEILLAKARIGQTPSPVATLTFSATGFPSASAGLPVVYG